MREVELDRPRSMQRYPFSGPQTFDDFMWGLLCVPHGEKIMEIIQDFSEKKSYNNNGKLWKSSRLLRVKPNSFIFLTFSSFFIFSFFFSQVLNIFLFGKNCFYLRFLLTFRKKSCLKEYTFGASCVFFVVCCAYTWWPASVQFLRSLLSAFFVSILFSARVLFS